MKQRRMIAGVAVALAALLAPMGPGDVHAAPAGRPLARPVVPVRPAVLIEPTNRLDWCVVAAAARNRFDASPGSANCRDAQDVLEGLAFRLRSVMRVNFLP